MRGRKSFTEENEGKEGGVGLHPKYEVADEASGIVIGAAIEVHRHMGAGLIESIYEKCLLHELELRELQTRSQSDVQVRYKGISFEEPLRYDVLVADCLLLELKAVEKVQPIHKAQLLSYMKLLDIPVGLLINFNVSRLKEGVSRMLLPGANLEDVDF